MQSALSVIQLLPCYISRYFLGLSVSLRGTGPALLYCDVFAWWLWMSVKASMVTKCEVEHGSWGGGFPAHGGGGQC